MRLCALIITSLAIAQATDARIWRFGPVGHPRARVAMMMTRHNTPSVLQRYNIVSDGDLREAAQKLNVAAGR